MTAANSSLSDLTRRAATFIDSVIDSPRPCPRTGRRMRNFRPFDRDSGFLLPASVDESLLERHLARFAVEVIDGLDLSAMRNSYRGTGSASYHPAVLPGVLVYGYAIGVFSSRKLDGATYDSVAFRFVASNDHPTTTPSRHFGGAFFHGSRRCSSRCRCWGARDGRAEAGHGGTRRPVASTSLPSGPGTRPKWQSEPPRPQRPEKSAVVSYPSHPLRRHCRAIRSIRAVPGGIESRGFPNR